MNESSFVPANDTTWSEHFADEVKRAIADLPAKLVSSARRATLRDIRAALDELPPEWTVTVDGKPWAVTLKRRQKGRVTEEMAMYVFGDDDQVAIQGYAEDAITAIGQWLADRCGPQVFSTELQPEDDRLFVPRRR